MVSLYGILNSPPNRIIFENQRIVLPSKYETWGFALFLDISSSSRDMRENRKWSICTAAILKFPAKQDFFLIKELCHLVHKTSEQMPFKKLRYLI